MADNNIKNASFANRFGRLGMASSLRRDPFMRSLRMGATFWRRYQARFESKGIHQEDVIDQARLTFLAYGELEMWSRLIKWMRIITIIIMMFGYVGISLAQELPICTKSSGMQWELNLESDMATYQIYKAHAPLSIVLGTTLVFASINHDPSQFETLPDGSVRIQTTIPIPIPDGPVYFAITAMDKSGNESGLSNEVGCVIDFPPLSPSGLMIIQFISP